METAPFAEVNFSGAVEPSSVTDFTPVTSFTLNVPPGQRGRIAYTSLPFCVKKASMLALPGSGFEASLVTS